VVLEEIYLHQFSSLPCCLDIYQNLSDERRNGIDRAWHGQDPGSRHSSIGQKGVDELSEGPYLRDFARQSFECLDGIFHDRLIEDGPMQAMTTPMP
jgi:hypothetical protein